MSDVPVHPRSFGMLAEAIDFIAGCTESDSALALFGETLVSEEPAKTLLIGGRPVALEQPAERFARGVFPELRQQHERMDLRVRYKDQSFPTDAESLKLGGHARELGHIHIDFIRRDEGWFIAEIWECR